MSETAELSIVIPTFNEVGNVGILVEKLEAQFDGLRWEALFVDDDSSDGTRDALILLAQEKPHVRMIQRIGRRGLSSAVVEGILSTTAPYIAVMDADLQHDESLLPAMLDVLRDSDTEIVVGSRYMAGGGCWRMGTEPYPDQPVRRLVGAQGHPVAIERSDEWLFHAQTGGL